MGSRRARAILFLGVAALAALVGAALVAGYGSSVARGYGPLRRVLVTTAPLPAGRAIDPAVASASLEARRVPSRFVPPGALELPEDALGLAPRGPLPAGSYVLAGQLRPPAEEKPLPGLIGGRRPVEINVSGAAALLAAGGSAAGARVDVVVTTEPSGPGPGRTFVAASRVPLLDLGPGEDGPGAAAAATLGLTRRQALRLIAAESFARKLTLIPER